MKRRFVLMVDRASNDEQKTVTDLLSSLNLAWWHYHQDSWLVIDPKGKWDVYLLLRKVLETLHPGEEAPNRHLMVTSASREFWGVFPVESAPWLDTHWKTE